MKPTQNTILLFAVCVGVFLLIVLDYLAMSHYGAKDLSLSDLAILGGMTTVPVLAALPTLLRRWKHMPPAPPLPRADLMFILQVGLLGCVLGIVGIHYNIWYLVTLAILLVPLSAMLRVKMIPGGDTLRVPTGRLVLVLVIFVATFAISLLWMRNNASPIQKEIMMPPVQPFGEGNGEKSAL
jgi:hypothetical protein